MRRIPLFPLPIVLFPGASLPIHVFEPRYRAMVARCLELDRSFGLPYHDPDERGPFLGERATIGSIAEIEQARPLGDGRWLIVARGVGRFQIAGELETSEPYYVAAVTPYGDITRPARVAMRTVRARTLRLFHTVLETSCNPPDEVPEFDPGQELSFQLAPLVQIDERWRQSLLELQDEAYRLERLEAVFQAAIDRRSMGGEGVA